MDEHCYAGDGLELELLANRFEDSGDACSRIECEVERPLTVHVRRDDDDPTVIVLVWRCRERAVQIQLVSGAARQREDRGNREQVSPA